MRRFLKWFRERRNAFHSYSDIQLQRLSSCSGIT
jgi:hypothetical protein